MRSILLAVTTLLAATCGALAADIVAEEPPVHMPVPVASAFDWTGAYFGAQAGYEFGRSPVRFPTLPPEYSNPDPSGFVGGIYIGFNRQLESRIVLGAEADLSYSHGRGDDVLRTTLGPPASFEHWKARSDWNAALRGRVGYALDRTLFYAAGGVAFTNLKTGVVDFGVLRGEASDARIGWTIGAGIEHALTDRLLARIEYRYADFGTKHYSTNGIPSTIATDVGLTAHDIRIGLAYKF